MGKPKAPPAPDYTSAAVASGESSKEVTRDQNYANRPDQTTPWGTTKWNSYGAIDPATGQPVTRWNQTQTLRPELEAALGSEVAQTQYRSNLARDLMGRMEGGLKETPSFDEFGTIGDMRQGAEDAAYQRQTSRLDPRFAKQDQQLEVQLRGQGLVPGSEAWREAKMEQARAKNDAYGQAQSQSVAEGRQETSLSAQLRQQEIAEYLQERGVPINEVNALMTGQQVQSPQMPGFNTASRAQGVDYLGAAGQQYDSSLDAFNIGQSSKQGLQSGMFNLAGAGLKGYMGMA